MAELAGTVNAVRHHREVGLLEMPEPTDNGYKQRRTSHHVCLTHITRSKDLGIPLAKARLIITRDRQGRR